VRTSLAGAVVAVTGASSGIGRETAMLFGREGARVAISARRLDRLESLGESIRAAGGEVLVMRVDVASEVEVRGFVAAILERFGRLDVFVNNAGYGVHGRVEETASEAYERLMKVNYLGTVYGCRAAVPVMRRQGSGVIINVSSIVGKRALPGGGAYAATKAAQVSLTEALRVELKGSGVEACSVHPIGTDTEFAEVAARETPDDRSGPLGPRQSAKIVAESIVACAKRPRPEVYPYLASRLIPVLNALSPGLADRVALWGARRSGRA
jgi:NAD(P)-dependent dehydrogenase (short-subunit alcohol dehydrogenase family)